MTDKKEVSYLLGEFCLWQGSLRLLESEGQAITLSYMMDKERGIVPNEESRRDEGKEFGLSDDVGTRRILDKRI